MGLLLKVRVAVYAFVMIPILAATEVDWWMRLVAAGILALAAGVPFVVRRGGRYSGVRLSAGIDVILAYVLWVVLPGAAGITLVVAIWAVGVVVFFSRRSTAYRFVGGVILLELSKIGFVVFAPEIVERGQQGLIWFIVARALAIAAAFMVMLALDTYYQRLSVAAETGSERYQRLMDSAPTAFLVVDAGIIAYANQAGALLLDSTQDELAGAPFDGFVVEAERGSISDRIARSVDRLEPFSIQDVGMVSAKGERLHVDAAATPIDFDTNLAVQIALHDVSAQRKAEDELVETRLNYRSFFERIPVALYRSRPNGEIIQANRALVDLLGARSESALVGVNARTFYADGTDRDHLTSMLSEQRVVVGYEAKMRRFDGTEIWVRDTSRMIDSDIGDIYEGAMVDVTGRRNIEDELWSRAVQQEAAASIGQTALEGKDMAAVMRSVTESVARVLRTDGAVALSRDPSAAFHILGQSAHLDLSAESVSALADRVHMTAAPVVLRSPQEIESVAPALASAGIESAVAVMIPGTDMDFGTLLVLSRSERVFTPDDLNFLHSVANVLAAAVDRASAYERLEELLRSKDAFVASVSHELRTPLTVVSGMALELSERWADLSAEEMAEFTLLLVEQSQDMSDLIEDLLVAARANIGNVTVVSEPIELERQVKSVVASINAPAGRRISTHLNRGIVDADAIRVRQIVRNLITNAIRYGGPNVDVVMSSTAGTHVVEVIDDGQGISLEDRDRVFIAYERAHHAEGQPESVGLGLTVSRTLAELMGGSLTYAFDGHSVFRLELSRNVEEERKLHSLRGPKVSPAQAAGAVGVGRIGVDLGVAE